MNTNGLDEKLDATTEAIIGAAFRVSNSLGCGFLEIVGQYQADLLVDGEIVVELKAVHCLDRIHRAQCLNYLRATGKRLGLLVNFGRPRVDVERIVAGY